MQPQSNDPYSLEVGGQVIHRPPHSDPEEPGDIGVILSINEQAGTAMVKYRNIETPLTTYLDYLHPTTPVNEGDTDV